MRFQGQNQVAAMVSYSFIITGQPCPIVLFNLGKLLCNSLLTWPNVLRTNNNIFKSNTQHAHGSILAILDDTHNECDNSAL